MSKVTIELDDEQTVQLRELELRTGLNTDELVSEAIAVLANALDSEEGQPHSPAQERAIREGLAAIERGDVIPHEQMFAELRRKFGG